MEIPQGDFDRPGVVRSTPPECTHPRERLRWVGDFSGEPDHWVFRVDCLRCGGSWDHTSEDDNAPWDQVTRMLEEGRFSRLRPGLGPARGATRATAAVAEHTTEIMRDLESMGATKFPID